MGIDRAHLVGFSLGGSEITRLAGLHPDRVLSLIYLDAAYDWSAAQWSWPSLPWLPAEKDLQSFDAYKTWFADESIRAGGAPWSEVEAYARDCIVPTAEGGFRFLEPDSAGWSQRSADHAAYRNDYSRVKAPVMAIYLPDVVPLIGDSVQQAALRRWSKEIFGPWQAEQRAQFERALPSAEVHVLPSLHHANFLLASPEEIGRLMSAFLARADAGVTH